jgi:hypothetical protein
MAALRQLNRTGEARAIREAGPPAAGRHTRIGAIRSSSRSMLQMIAERTRHAMGGHGHLWVCLVIRVHCICDFCLGLTWDLAGQGVPYLKDGESVAIAARRGGRVQFIAGDKALA